MSARLEHEARVGILLFSKPLQTSVRVLHIYYLHSQVQSDSHPVQLSAYDSEFHFSVGELKYTPVHFNNSIVVMTLVPV